MKFYHHDLSNDSTTLQYLLLQSKYPEFPLPVGIFRQVNEETFEETLDAHKSKAESIAKIQTLHDLMYSGDTWTIK